MNKTKILAALAVTASAVSPLIIATSCGNKVAYKITIDDASKVKQSQMREEQKYTFVFSLNKVLDEGVELHALVIPTYSTILKITKPAVVTTKGTIAAVTFSAIAESLTSTGSSTNFSIQFTFTKDNQILQSEEIQNFRFVQQPTPIADNVIWNSRTAVTKAGKTTVTFGYSLKLLNPKDKVTVAIKSQQGTPIAIKEQVFDTSQNWGGLTVEMSVTDIYMAAENIFNVTVTCKGYNEWSEDVNDIHMAFTPAPYDIPIKNIEYKIEGVSPAYAVITGIKNPTNEDELGYCKRLIIPKTLGDHLVSRVDAAAFYNLFCKGGKYPNVEEVVFEENDYLVTIGNYAFQNCNSLAKPLVIPASVTTIGESAFEGTRISSLKIEESATAKELTIGTRAFKDCTYLAGDINLPQRVTSVGQRAFFGCSYADGTLTIQNQKAKLEDEAFGDCTSITGLNLESFTAVPSAGIWTKHDSGHTGCFNNLGGGENVSISAKADLVESLITEVSSCSTETINLTYKILTHEYDFDYDANGFITGFKNGVELGEKEVLYIPKQYNNGTTLVDIQGIADGAFYSSTTGKSLIPSNINKIAFASNSAMTRIGKNAFRGSVFNKQSRIGELYLPDSITNIDAQGFAEAIFPPQLDGTPCPLHLPTSLTTLGDGAFASYVTTVKPERNFCIDGMNLPQQLASVGANCFKGCVLKNDRIKIPKSLTDVKDNAFDVYKYDSTALTMNYINFSEWVKPPEWSGKNVFGQDIGSGGILEIKNITQDSQYNEWDQYVYQEDFRKTMPDIGLKMQNFSFLPTTMIRSAVKINDQGKVTGFATYGNGEAVSMEDILNVCKKKDFRGKTVTGLIIPSTSWEGKQVTTLIDNALDASTKLLLDSQITAISFPSTTKTLMNDCIRGQKYIQILDFTRLKVSQFMGITFEPKSIIISEDAPLGYLVVSSTWTDEEIQAAQNKINTALGTDKYWSVVRYSAK